MKKLIVLWLVVISIFSFGAVTMAEGSGTDLYLDYTFMNFSPGSQKYNAATLGVDYNQDVLALGGYYSTAVSYDPSRSGWSDNAFFVYGGYNFAQGESSVAAIVSYLNWNFARPDSNTLTSLGIGLRGSLNFEAGNVSLLYSYGLSNAVTGGTGTINTSVLEAKGVYYFGDSLGMHLVYRYIPFKSNVIDSSLNGIGLGFDFKL
jgi:hypothetical protein